MTVLVPFLQHQAGCRKHLMNLGDTRKSNLSTHVTKRCTEGYNLIKDKQEKK